MGNFSWGFGTTAGNNPGIPGKDDAVPKPCALAHSQLVLEQAHSSMF
jgi:hypothetical protein